MVHAGGLIFLALTASSTSSRMIHIPAATFVMGSNDARHSDEAPAHEVELSAFEIDDTLVTVADFERFVNETHYVTTAEKLGFGMTFFEGMKDWTWQKVEGATWRMPWGKAHAADIPVHPDHPVVMVSWIDANAYCRHRGARLPTEAEWEYAMRAGSKTRFPWGDKEQGLNFWQGHHEHNERRDPYLYTSPVRAFPPNAFGIYDPVGNVWQWVQDWYAPDAYSKSARKDPQGPAEGKRKASRGGSWWCSKTTCYGYTVFANNGFRCAKSE